MDKLTANAIEVQNVADDISGCGAKTCVTIAENSELYAIRADRISPDKEHIGSTGLTISAMHSTSQWARRWRTLSHERKMVGRGSMSASC